MKTIVLIGRMNEQLRKLNDYLRAHFHVQLCTENPQSAIGMVKVIGPDLILLSLAGLSGLDHVIFARLKKEFPSLPVLTLGSDNERRLFEQYYQGSQFENLPYPAEDREVYAAVCRRLGISAEESRGEGAAPAGDRKTVLVVDDNAATLRGIKAMLERKYNVTLANSGVKAMTSMGKNRPDVILLDYEMPVCDGRQTLEMIRADEDLRDIPVIFLTSVNDKEHIQAVIKLLPAGYMLKPAVPGKLIGAIEKALGNA